MTTICLHLVGPQLEGAWMDVKAMPPSYIRGDGQMVALVATGHYEYDGDRKAEVWVPEDMHPLWRMEHAIDC